MLHIDFVLGGRRFLHHAVKGQVLDLAGDAQVLQHRLVVIEHVQPVGVAAHWGLVGQAGAGVQRHRLVPPHQAEFQLGGDHRAPALFLVERQHLLEHMAGIAHIGSPVIVEHGQHDLAVLALGGPGGGQQRAFHRATDAVGIAGGEHQLLHIAAPDIQAQGRFG